MQKTKDLDRRSVLVIGGPTASGKSHLALTHALTHNGIIINADSMQVYQGLPILTAQPQPPYTVPHQLYGYRAPEAMCSAALWLNDAVRVIAQAQAAEQKAIVVGGTGLYLKALLHGLSPIPEIPMEVRTQTRAHLEAIGVQAFYQELLEKDPLTAAGLKPTDTQRLARAWEVLEATGKPLRFWQDQPPQKCHDFTFEKILVNPSAPVLEQHIRTRLDSMFAAGVVDEVAAFHAQYAGQAVPVMNALGYQEIVAHIAGQLSYKECFEKVATATRQYAKRQRTWFKGQW